MDVQLALSRYVSERGSTDQDMPVVMAALVGAEMWLSHDDSFESPDPELIVELAHLHANAFAFIVAGPEGTVMVSADSDGRCGLSISNDGTNDPTLHWYSPPDVDEDTYRVLRPFQAALGVTNAGGHND